MCRAAHRPLRSFVVAAILSISALLSDPPLSAQGPSAPWRTLTTEHYRLHYPAPFEAWATAAAERLEAIREKVGAEIGFAPEEVVDIVVSDPIARANGSAIPVLGAARMNLWTQPPDSSSIIGNYRSWPELLLVHEDAHLVHMLRPSRNPARRLLSRLLPTGPITLSAPRWVTEGYATVVEGRLTGSGRPFGDLRAVILRRKAQLGQLPSYGRLAADSESWNGMAMAYLAGSAFLEWLDERSGPGSLPRLWARMTARHSRSFEEAFAGVYGDSPARLYGRFTAELTYRAMQVEERLEPGLAEGELWQDLSWNTGRPVISPDGSRLAAVLRSRDRDPRLVILGTGPNEEAEKEWRETRDALLEADAEDVPAVRHRPLPRKPEASLASRDGRAPSQPAWMPDGESLLFVRFEPDGEGFLHPDLFRWWPESGRRQRLTRLADLRQPDPAPDGTWAVALRQRHGYSELVRVDLESAVVTSLTPPSITTVYAQPRIAPDGKRIAFTRNRGEGWELVTRELERGDEIVLAAPRATLAFPAWSADGRSVFATVGETGLVDVRRFPADRASEGEAITRAAGAALAPAPTPDGQALFYLGVEADGLDLRRLELGAETAAEHRLAASLEPTADFAPALPRPAPEAAPYLPSEVGAAQPYGLGRGELFPLFGGHHSSSVEALEIGLRRGDLLGRSNTVLLGSLSPEGERDGAALATVWRGLPVDLGLHLYGLRERPSRQPKAVPGLAGSLDAERYGAEFTARWDRLWAGARWRLGGGLLVGEIEPRSGSAPSEPTLSRRVVFVEAGYRDALRSRPWRVVWGVDGRFDAGRTEEDSWRRHRLGVEVELGWEERALRLVARRGGSDDLPSRFDLFVIGGVGSGLLPSADRAARVFEPALPTGVLLGERFDHQRAEVTLGGAIPTLFFGRVRTTRGGGDSWTELAGAEWTLRTGPAPIVRLPAVDLRIGAAYLFDEPFADDVHGWVSVTWKP